VGHLLQPCSSDRLSAPELDNIDVVRCQSIRDLNYGSSKLTMGLAESKPRSLGNNLFSDRASR
jgi:hypothetical protein